MYRRVRADSGSVLATILITLIEKLRPLMGSPGGCRYTMGCTDYARFVLERYPLFTALGLLVKRLLSC